MLCISNLLQRRKPLRRVRISKQHHGRSWLGDLSEKTYRGMRIPPVRSATLTIDSRKIFDHTVILAERYRTVQFRSPGTDCADAHDRAEYSHPKCQARARNEKWLMPDRTFYHAIGYGGHSACDSNPAQPNWDRGLGNQLSPDHQYRPVP